MRTRVKQAVIRALDRAGFALIPHWRLDRHPMATYLGRLFKYLGTDCVIDVGANGGQYRDFLRNEVGYQGRIVSFEPIPAHVSEMRGRSASDPRWTIREAALGAVSGNATFNVMRGTQFSSFLSPRDTHSAQFGEQNTVREQVRVSMLTLDEVVPQLVAEFAPRSLYLKMDTQGYDLEVLKGGSRVMRHIRGMQTEVSVTPLYEGAPDYVTTMRTLESLGFVFSGMFPNNEGHFPQLIEFDCFVVARDALASAG